MIQKILKDIEKEIIDWYSNQFPEFADTFYSQISLIDDIEKEFTGSGAFISFHLKDDNYIKVDENKSPTFNRLDGLCISSKDFIHDVPVSIEINRDGKIKYIEFEFGMKEKKYPKEFTLKSC